MDDKLMARCRREFERQVKVVFEASRGLPNGHDVHEAPFIGGPFYARAPRQSHVPLMQEVVRALCAQRWFEETAPKWAQPLPLRIEECEALLKDPDEGQRLVARYALMLRSTSWECSTHPPFNEFCAAVRRNEGLTGA